MAKPKREDGDSAPTPTDGDAPARSTAPPTTSSRLLSTGPGFGPATPTSPPTSSFEQHSGNVGLRLRETGKTIVVAGGSGTSAATSSTASPSPPPSSVEQHSGNVGLRLRDTGKTIVVAGGSGTSAAATDHELTATSSSPSPSSSRVAGAIAVSGLLAAATSTTASSSPPLDENDRAADFGLHLSNVAGTAVAPLHGNGSDMSEGKVTSEAENVNYGSASTASSSSAASPNSRAVAPEGYDLSVPTMIKLLDDEVQQLKVRVRKTHADFLQKKKEAMAECLLLREQGTKMVDELAQHSQARMMVLDDELKELKVRLEKAQEDFMQKEKEMMERLLFLEQGTKMVDEGTSRALPYNKNNEGAPDDRCCCNGLVLVQALHGTTATDLTLPLLQGPPMMEDHVWNKRQIIYVLYLGLAMGVIVLIRPLLPHGFDRYFLAGFAAVWGLGSIGLPFGIYGTSRFEKNFSRYIAHFGSLCFSLMVIYATYLLAMKPMHADETSPSPPPSPIDVDDDAIAWKIIFSVIALIDSAGHVFCCVRGYFTGGDRDLTPEVLPPEV